MFKSPEKDDFWRKASVLRGKLHTLSTSRNCVRTSSTHLYFVHHTTTKTDTIDLYTLPKFSTNRRRCLFILFFINLKKVKRLSLLKTCVYVVTYTYYSEICWISCITFSFNSGFLYQNMLQNYTMDFSFVFTF